MNYVAAEKDMEIRDGLDSELGGEGGFGLGVDLEDKCMAGHLFGEEFEFRGGYPARSAPRCPEVDEDGDGGLLDDFGEGGGVDGEGLREGGEEGFTFTTTAAMGEMGGGDAVGGRAFGTGGEEGEGHYFFTPIW